MSALPFMSVTDPTAQASRFPLNWVAPSNTAGAGGARGEGGGERSGWAGGGKVCCPGRRRLLRELEAGGRRQGLGVGEAVT